MTFEELAQEDPELWNLAYNGLAASLGRVPNQSEVIKAYTVMKQK